MITDACIYAVVGARRVDVGQWTGFSQRQPHKLPESDIGLAEESALIAQGLKYRWPSEMLRLSGAIVDFLLPSTTTFSSAVGVPALLVGPLPLFPWS